MDPKETLCYCFGYTRDDIRREVAATGNSTIPARIVDAIRADCCACVVNHPQGICCLVQVRRAVKEEIEQQAATANAVAR